MRSKVKKCANSIYLKSYFKTHYEADQVAWESNDDE